MVEEAQLEELVVQVEELVYQLSIIALFHQHEQQQVQVEAEDIINIQAVQVDQALL